MATRLAATKLMLVRSIFLDIGKLLDGSFALGGATSVQIHAAHAIRLRARMRLLYLMSLPQSEAQAHRQLQRLRQLRVHFLRCDSSH